MRDDTVPDYTATGSVTIDSYSFPGEISIKLNLDPPAKAEAKIVCEWSRDTENKIGDIFSLGSVGRFEGTIRPFRAPAVLIPRFEVVGIGSDYPVTRVTLCIRPDLIVDGDLDPQQPSTGTIYSNLEVPIERVYPLLSQSCVEHNGPYPTEEDFEQAYQLEIKWETGVGTASLRCLTSEYGDRSADGFAMLRVNESRASLHIETTVTNSGTKLGDLLIEQSEAMKDSLLLISFLMRQRVDWFQGSAMLIDDAVDTPRAPTARAFHMAWLGYSDREVKYPHSEDPLVTVEALQGGLLTLLLNGFVSHESQNAIRQTIYLVLMSYERMYVEASIASIYTALESLVSGVTEVRSEVANLISEDDFEQVWSEVKSQLKTSLIKVGVDLGSDRQRFYEKKRGMNRRSLVDKILILMAELKIDISAWWPSDRETEHRLREIIGRRNDFIHRGSITDYDTNQKDLRLLQTLVELLILKLLGCPDEAINKLAQQRTKSLKY